MKLLVIFVAILLTCVIAYEVELWTEEQWMNFLQDKSIDPETKGSILNSKTKKAIENAIKQMPCGWPNLGIPPLAPYTHPDLKVHLNKTVVDSLFHMLSFRFDGLNQMEIRNLQVSYTFSKKVKFHFNFKELKAQASEMNTAFLLDIMENFGLSVHYKGSGSMEFILENLSLEGQFKYKMPFIFGSIEIYNFKIVVTLGGVRSNIGGLLGNDKFNRFINDKIESLVPTLVNSYQEQIGAMIEETFVPRANEMMKGKKIWHILSMMGSSNNVCKPEPAPWLENEN